MNKIKISIIIPHYNRPEMILECLKSIQENDYPQKNYEVIVIDDCSTVNVESIKNYSKIMNYRFLKLAINSSGASVPRNYGLTHATGEYALFIDSDDTISKGFMSKTISLAQKGNCDIVNVPKSTTRTSESLMSKNYEQFKKDTVIKIKDDYKYKWPIFIDHQIHGRLIRMSLIKKHGIKFPEQVIKSEDRCFNRWVWTVATVAGICVSERYNLMTVTDSTTQLHTYETTVEDEFNMITFLLQNIMPIPEVYAEFNKKCNVFNHWFQSRYVVALSNSTYHMLLLKNKYGRYFIKLKESGKLLMKASEFVDKVLGIN